MSEQLTFETNIYLDTKNIPPSDIETYKEAKKLGGLSGCYGEFDSADSVYTVRVVQDNKMIGYLKGGIYPSTHLKRSSQWQFGENKDRSIWVDLCISTQKGIGRQLLKKFEEMLPKKVDGRQNIYVCSPHTSAAFYIKCGYHPIETPDNPSDKDVPLEFLLQFGCWLAKPLGLKLDQEIELYPSTGKLTHEFQLHWVLLLGDVEAFKRAFNFDFDINGFESYFGMMAEMYEKNSFY